MLSATYKIRSQLTKALVLICKHDLPDGWPDLLFDLIFGLQKAQSDNDNAALNGTINVWIKEMKPCLATYYPAIESSADGLALVDELRAAVCKAANLCI
ncbi:hypothetical protein ACE6H2_008029 [Prunus campanulata]